MKRGLISLLLFFLPFSSYSFSLFFFILSSKNGEELRKISNDHGEVGASAPPLPSPTAPL
jgi:hypothetical protein